MVIRQRGLDEREHLLLQLARAAQVAAPQEQRARVVEYPEDDFLNLIGAKPKRQFVVHNGIDTLPFASADPSLFEDRYGVKNFVRPRAAPGRHFTGRLHRGVTRQSHPRDHHP